MANLGNVQLVIATASTNILVAADRSTSRNIWRHGRPWISRYEFRSEILKFLFQRVSRWQCHPRTTHTLQCRRLLIPWVLRFLLFHYFGYRARREQDIWDLFFSYWHNFTRKWSLHVKRIILERWFVCNLLNVDVSFRSNEFRDSSEWRKYLVLETQLCTIEPEGWLVDKLGSPRWTRRIQEGAECDEFACEAVFATLTFSYRRQKLLIHLKGNLRLLVLDTSSWRWSSILDRRRSLPR